MRALFVTLAMLATAAVLSACGGSSALIPTGDAGQLQTDLNNVSTYVILHDCADTSTALAQLQSTFNGLPESVDASLRANLGKGLNALDSVARRECKQTGSSTGQTGPTEATGSTGTTSATGSTGATSSTSSTSSTTSSTATTSTTTSTSTSTVTSTVSTTSSAATSTGQSSASGPPTTGAGGGTPAGSTSATGATLPSGIGGSGGVASGN